MARLEVIVDDDGASGCADEQQHDGTRPRLIDVATAALHRGWLWLAGVAGTAWETQCFGAGEAHGVSDPRQSPSAAATFALLRGWLDDAAECIWNRVPSMPLRDLAVMQLEFLGMAMATLFGMTYTTQVKPEDFLSLPTGCAAPTTAVSSFQSYAAKVLVLAPPNCLCCFFLLCLLDGRARMATTKLFSDKVAFTLIWIAAYGAAVYYHLTIFKSAAQME